MNRSIEQKRREIAEWIGKHPSEGHPHYWCGGTEEDCAECNMDHEKTEVHLSMLAEERALFKGVPTLQYGEHFTQDEPDLSC